MKVYELIDLLKKKPQFSEVKIDDKEFVNDIDRVELDDRGFVVIRPQ